MHPLPCGVFAPQSKYTYLTVSYEYGSAHAHGAHPVYASPVHTPSKQYRVPAGVPQYAGYGDGPMHATAHTVPLGVFAVSHPPVIVYHACTSGGLHGVPMHPDGAEMMLYTPN
jgi:hypothetical protein